MRILHVTLANPDKHRGGSNTYCRELAATQRMAGHTVFLLYPGERTLKRNVKIVSDGNLCYRLQNALPVAIIFGIDDPRRYMVKLAAQENIYEHWLKEIAPNVIHVHSFMGLHKEFFVAAKEMAIPMVFTTHDYYPICYKCNLVDSDGNNCEGRCAAQCARCNAGAGLTQMQQMIMSSRLYETMKNNRVIYALKQSAYKNVSKAKMQNVACGKNAIKQEIVDLSERTADFTALGEYYNDIMRLITVIHCNSPLTKEYYKSKYPDAVYKTIPITHSGLIQKREDRSMHETAHFAYFGVESVYKGYYLLLEALQKLDEMGSNAWSIDVYGGHYKVIRQDQRIHYKGFCLQDEMEQAYRNIDVVIVPSQGPETFGFVVLEALSNGVPVICSDLVGSNYLVKAIDERLIAKHGNAEDLAAKMKMIVDFKQTEYQDLCKTVKDTKLPIDMKEHSDEMLKLYENCIKTKNEEVRNDSNTQQNYK